MPTTSEERVTIPFHTLVMMVADYLGRPFEVTHLFVDYQDTAKGIFAVQQGEERMGWFTLKAETRIRLAVQAVERASIVTITAQYNPRGDRVGRAEYYEKSSINKIIGILKAANTSAT